MLPYPQRPWGWRCARPSKTTWRGHRWRCVAAPGGAARCLQARLERLGEDEALGFTFRMLEGTGASGGKAAAGRGSGSAEEEGLDCTALQAAVVACVRMAAEAAGLAEAQGQAAEARAAAVALGALALVAAEDSGGDGGRRLSRDAYRKWVKRVPALHAALSGVLLRVGAGGGGGGGGVPRCPACLGPPLPQLVQLGKLAPHATLLQLTWSWVVSSRLPPGGARAGVPWGTFCRSVTYCGLCRASKGCRCRASAVAGLQTPHGHTCCKWSVDW